MMSAWGLSFGSAWGSSWGSIAPKPIITIDTHDGDYRRKQQKDSKAKQRANLERIYRDVIVGPMVEEAVEIVRPFAKSEAIVPRSETIDWEAFIADIKAMDKMQEIRAHMQMMRDDDQDVEDILMLLQ